jgi:hypothetical protein
MGYRPTYLAVRAAWHARREPAAVAMLWGYVSAALSGRGRCRDETAVAYVRRRQSARHLYRAWRDVRGSSGN